MKIRFWKLRNKLGLIILESILFAQFRIYAEIPACANCDSTLITVKKKRDKKGIYRRQTCHNCKRVLHTLEKKITLKEFEKNED